MYPGISIQERMPWAKIATVGAGGECFVSDPRGSGQSIYHLTCTDTTAQFEVIDRTTGTRMPLAAPLTNGGTARFGTGTAICMDMSGPVPFGGGVANLWLVHARANAPFLDLQFYNSTTDVWTLASQAGGAFNAVGLGNAALNGQWNGDIAMAHPCTAVGLAVSDDFLYIVGGNTANVGAAALYTYRYTISTGTVAAMAARGGAVGDGCTLNWLSKWPDRIYSRRGGAGVLFDSYGIAGNAWGAVTPVPNDEAYTLGDSAVSCEWLNMIVSYKGGRLLVFNPQFGTTYQLGQVYGDDGAGYRGMPLCLSRALADLFFYALPHGSSVLHRIRTIPT